MRKTHIKNVFESRGQWLYKLQCPFNMLPYMPIDSATMAKLLKISQRTALRICKGERELTHAELHLLQFKVFGCIDDPQFKRDKFYIKNGILYCHLAPNYELGAGQILEFALLIGYYKNAVLELAETKKRLNELENPKPEKPSNVIKFSD